MFDEYSGNNNRRDIRFDVEARTRLIEGIDKLAQAVKTTLGPGGRNVIITRPGQTPLITKDGVTVAQHVRLKDPHHDAGAQVVLEAASRTNDVAGDGTTTATILAQEIVHLGQKVLAAGYQPKRVKRGMETALDDLVCCLKDTAQVVQTSEQIEHVGTISANGDRDVGRALARAMDAVGTQGIITIEDAKGLETQLELIDGVRLDRGYTSPYFVNDIEKMQVVFEEPYVLLSDRSYKTMQEVLPVLEKVRAENKPILIIANEVKDDALKVMTLNKTRGDLQPCVIIAPGRGDARVDLLGDLAAILGGDVITEGDDRTGADIELEHLGRCDRVVITRHDTTIIGGWGLRDNSALRDKRKKGVEDVLNSGVSLPDSERGKLEERLAVLGGAAAIIKVGGATEVEVGERRDRIVDALNATQAAAAEGIVPGGGTTLFRSAAMLRKNVEKIDDRAVAVGYSLILDACSAPIRQILENAGHNAAKVMATLEDISDTRGFDAATGEYVDMLERGIVDPVKVTRSALQNATSVGGIVLTVGASIVDED